MSISVQQEVYVSSEDDMAKRRALPDQAIVAAYLQRLKAAGLDRYSFDLIVTELDTLRGKRVTEVIVIAQVYIGGGKAPSSGKAAVAAISMRFLEKVRAEAKGKIAEKARTW